MYYDATGREDPNGDFQLINGRLCVRDGRSVRFEMAYMDAAPGSRTFTDAKAEPPKTIDEALRLKFAELAKGQNTTVREMLASMPQAKIEEVAAQVATDFISAQAGQGVASQFATDGAILADAERDYAVAQARRDHANRYGYLPESQRPAFTADAAAAAVTVAMATKIRDQAVQDEIAAQPESNPSYRHGMDVALRATRKAIISDGWRC